MTIFQFSDFEVKYTILLTLSTLPGLGEEGR